MEQNPYQSPSQQTSRLHKPRKPPPRFLRSVRLGTYWGVAAAVVWWLILAIWINDGYLSVPSMVWLAFWIWTLYIILLGTVLGILVGGVRKLLWLARSHF